MNGGSTNQSFNIATLGSLIAFTVPGKSEEGGTFEQMLHIFGFIRKQVSKVDVVPVPRDAKDGLWRPSNKKEDFAEIDRDAEERLPVLRRQHTLMHHTQQIRHLVVLTLGL